MSDITISPIPYNGGSMSNTPATRTCCDLGGGVLLNVAYQSNPAYLFAWVNTLTNVKTGTLSTVNSPMRALLTASTTPAATSGAPFCRLWKLNSNSALLLMNTSLYVIQITANNDVIIKNGTLSGFNNYAFTYVQNGSYNTNGASYALGSALMGWYIRDNCVYFSVRGTQASNFSMNLVKVAYDATNDVLSQSTLSTTTIPQTNTQCFVHPELKAIPGSTKRLLTFRTGLTQGVNQFNASYSTITASKFVDTVTDTVTTGPGAIASAVNFVPLSETTVLGLNTGGTSYYTWQSGVWNGTAAVYGSTALTYYLFAAEALDANYFIIFAIQSSNDLVNTSSAGFSCRVGRFIDNTFGQTSAATAAAAGVALTSTVPYYFYGDQPVFQRQGSDSFYTYGMNSAFAPSIGVTYQPGG